MNRYKVAAMARTIAEMHKAMINIHNLKVVCVLKYSLFP